LFGSTKKICFFSIRKTSHTIDHSFVIQVVAACRIYSRLIQSQRTSARSTTARDALLHVLERADATCVDAMLGAHNDKVQSVMQNNYFSTDEWDILCAGGHVDSIGEPYHTQLRSLLKFTKDNTLQFGNKFNTIFVGKNLKPRKETKKMKNKRLSDPTPVPAPDGTKRLALMDAESRNKIFARLYFLQLFLTSPYGCAKKMVTGHSTKGEYSISESSYTLCVNRCMSKALARFYVDRLPSDPQNAQLGNHKSTLYLIELIVGFNTGHSTLTHTQRFLNKLPGCIGDLAPLFREYKSINTRKKKYLPFAEEKVSAGDCEFISHVLLKPAEALQNAIEHLLVERFKPIMENTMAEPRRIAATKKTFSFHVTRQVNTSWIKIVNMVGSDVRPTLHTNDGKQKPIFFWWLLTKKFDRHSLTLFIIFQILKSFY
jgi:hypothetical protein